MLKLLSKWIQEEKSLKFYLQQHFLQCTKVCIYINHNRLSRFNAMSFLICCRLSFCGFVGGAAPSRRWSLYMLVYVRACVCVGVSVCVCVSRASWHLNCVLLIVKLLLWAAKWPTGRMRNAHYAYAAWPQFEEKMRNAKCEMWKHLLSFCCWFARKYLQCRVCRGNAAPQTRNSYFLN